MTHARTLNGRLRKMTSEEQVSIATQPPETCPIINKCIKNIENCQGQLSGYEKMELEELRECLQFIEYELAELVGFREQGHLEDIRKNVVAIRAWGQEWKDLAKSEMAEFAA